MHKTYRHTFYHPILGKLNAVSDGRNIYVAALPCARKLLYLRAGRALINSGALPSYCLVKGRIPRETMIDIRHAWKLFPGMRGLRKLLASEMYDWLYDVIAPAMRKGACDL